MLLFDQDVFLIAVLHHSYLIHEERLENVPKYIEWSLCKTVLRTAAGTFPLMSVNWDAVLSVGAVSGSAFLCAFHQMERLTYCLNYFLA